MSREVERVWVVGDDQVLYVEWQGDERWGVAVVPVALSEAVYVEGSAMGDVAAVVTWWWRDAGTASEVAVRFRDGGALSMVAGDGGGCQIVVDGLLLEGMDVPGSWRSTGAAVNWLVRSYDDIVRIGRAEAQDWLAEHEGRDE